MSYIRLVAIREDEKGTRNIYGPARLGLAASFGAFVVDPANP